MCKDCSICNGTSKMSDTEIIKKGYVTFGGKSGYKEYEITESNLKVKGAILSGNKVIIPSYSVARCHLCGCSWITDVGRFRN